MPLVQLVYASATARPFSKQQLVKLLDLCRSRNAERDVTGVLLLADDTFFQVLEGEEDTVMALFEHISKDPRHSRILMITKIAVEERVFGEWSMGFQRMTAADFNKYTGLNDILARGSALADIDQGKTETLLAAFKAGRWRIAA
jgi:hypothetical protein